MNKLLEISKTMKLSATTYIEVEMALCTFNGTHKTRR
jgi:hypothetical protein